MKRNLLIDFAGIIGSALLVGCVTVVLTPIIQKAYDVTSKIESAVVNSDNNKFVTIAEEIKAPLFIVKSAINYLAIKLTNKDIVVMLTNASQMIDKVYILLDNVTLQNVEVTKVTVIDTINILKMSIVSCADFLKVSLNTNTTLSVGVDIMDDIKADTEDLKKLLIKNNAL